MEVRRNRKVIYVPLSVSEKQVYEKYLFETAKREGAWVRGLILREMEKDGFQTPQAEAVAL